MNKNTLHFLIWLVLLTAAVAWIWWRIPVAVAPGDGGFKGYLLLHQLVYLLFVLTPLLAVLITEKWRLKQIIQAISPDFVRDRCEKSGFLFGVYGYCVPSSDRRSRAVFC